MKITIYEIPPSNNKYMGNRNSNFLYHQEKERWNMMVRISIKERPDKPYEFSRITITYFFPDKRRRDPDNYSGKFLLDPLVKEGIIADDSFDHIDLEIRKGGVDRKNPRTEIEVEERSK